MKKVFSIIIATVSLLLAPITVFANEENITLTDIFSTGKEVVTKVQITLPEDRTERFISDKGKIEEFFDICDNTLLLKLDNPENAGLESGMYIMLETADGKFGGFAYIMNNGYADKYSMFMSRLPAKVYAFESAEAAQIVTDKFLSLAETKNIICSDWAREYIINAEKTNICSYLDYTLPATRLEFCEMLYSMTRANVKIPDESSFSTGIFSDCDSYAVMYLYDIGVVSGTGENIFSPEEKINREQAAVMVYGLAKYLNMNGFLENHMLSSYMYVDRNDMSDWAVEAIYGLKTAGIMTGVGGDLFAPKDLFTLEQSAALTLNLFTHITGI